MKSICTFRGTPFAPIFAVLILFVFSLPNPAHTADKEKSFSKYEQLKEAVINLLQAIENNQDTTDLLKDIDNAANPSLTP